MQTFLYPGMGQATHYGVRFGKRIKPEKSQEAPSPVQARLTHNGKEDPAVLAAHTPSKKRWTGWHTAMLASLMMLGTADGLLGLKMYRGKQMEDAMVVQSNNRQPIDQAPDLRHAWPANTKVYASALQSTQSRMNLEMGGAYTYQLFENLRKPGVNSFDDAHQPLAGGLKDINKFARWLTWSSQVPVTSTNPTQGWQKNENRTRYAILIQGDGGSDKEDAMFAVDMAHVSAVLQSEYHLPEENIVKLVHPTMAQIERAFKNMEAKQDPNSEVMVFVTSHGLSFLEGNRMEQPTDPEGKYEGVLENLGPDGSMFEFQLKRLFRESLSKFRAAHLVIDACYSGAWISQADIPAKAKSLA